MASFKALYVFISSMSTFSAIWNHFFVSFLTCYIIFLIDIWHISWYYLQFITISVSVELEFKCFEFASVRNSCTINFIFWLLWFNFLSFQKDFTLIYSEKWVINRCWIVIWQKVWHKNTRNKIIGKFVCYTSRR